MAEKDIVLRGMRLIIPEGAQAKIILVAHRGHQEMVKTKQLIKETVWFSGIDKKVEAAIKDFEACQRTVGENKPSPLIMTPLPNGP